MTRLTLSCAECGSAVDIAELHTSDTDATAALRVRCSACHGAGTVKVRSTGVRVTLDGDVSSFPSDATPESGRSSSVSPGDAADEAQTFRTSDEDSVAAGRETDAAGEKATTEVPANQGSESRSGRDTENESASESAASMPESESDESDDADYETVLDELDAVRSAGVKNLRDRSEVEGVARAVGHETLLAFLQDADDATYRTAVREATGPRD